MDLTPVMSIFRKDKREDTEGEKAYENRARDWSDVSASLGMPAAMRHWRRGALLVPLEEVLPC